MELVPNTNEKVPIENVDLKAKVERAQKAYQFILDRIEELKSGDEDNKENKLANLEKMQKISFENWQMAKQKLAKSEKSNSNETIGSEKLAA
jgi:Na+/phosphate symporter